VGYRNPRPGGAYKLRVKRESPIKAASIVHHLNAPATIRIIEIKRFFEWRRQDEGQKVHQEPFPVHGLESTFTGIDGVYFSVCRSIKVQKQKEI
jgi:hypothetical protein